MKNKIKILVIDDEEVILNSCHKILSKEGYEVILTNDGNYGLNILKEEVIDAVILDLKMPKMSGKELLKTIKENFPDVVIIIITGYSTIESAVEAMKSGASDYLPKPFKPIELILVIDKALEKKSLINENLYLRKKLSEEYKYKTIIGKHPKMKEVFELMEKVAKTDATILIYGETGTGKELVARTIHTMSFRSDKPFVPIDCMMLTESLLESELFGHVKGSFTGAIITKPGLLELANRGTLFFDEIGNLNLNIQSKLLRVIQEREFIPVGGTEKKKIDVRIIAATNRNLQDMIKGGMFREDLFYRLHIIPIYLPPLRERKSDIPLLVNYFMNEYSEKIGKKFDKIAPEAMKFFTEYEWVGNVRELENIIERLTIIHDGDSIFVEHIPHTFSSFETSLTSTIPQTNEELKEIKRIAKEKVVQEIEKKFLIAALKRNNWNISKAALETGMQRENFHTLMRKNNIKLREFQ